MRVNGGWLLGALGLGTDFEAGKGFAFLLQDGNDIVAGAAAQADQDQFHRAITAGFVAVDDDRVSAVSDPAEALLFNPGSFCGGHNLLPINLSGDYRCWAQGESIPETIRERSV